MPYVTRLKILNAYTPSDAVLTSNDAVKILTTTVYQKAKEMKIISNVYPDSRFRFKFDLAVSGAGGPIAYGRIYKNGVAIGTEWGEGASVWTTMTEDINIGNWQVDDTIELWLKTDVAGRNADCRNFRLCGIGSPLVNTVV
jgi:hypothetical protein